MNRSAARSTPASALLCYSTFPSSGLRKSFPNPVRAGRRGTIRYELPAQEKVSLTLFDAQGRTVRTLVEGAVQSGRQEVTFTPQRLSSGVYFYRLQAGEHTATHRLALMRWRARCAFRKS
jgi:hypothetical protein